MLLAVAAILSAISQNDDGGQETSDDAPFATAPTQSSTPASRPTTSIIFVTPPALQPKPTGLQFARVVGVIDGDTIDVVLYGEDERVRYYGIDTAERGESCFTEATERNAELAGDVVLLLPDARNRDRNGRLLRYVFDADGNSIDAALIAEGLAMAWREDGAYRDQLVEAEMQASAADVGCLWR